MVVTFEAGFLARRYQEESGLVWPLLVDEKRDVYRAYGMLDAGFWDVWGYAPGSLILKRYGTAGCRKNRPGISGSGAGMC